MTTLTTSVSLFSLVPIFSIWAILPRRPHGAHGPWWSRGSWVPCRPGWTRQAADQLGGVDGDVATFLGWQTRWLGDGNRQQRKHQTYLEHGGHCGVMRKSNILQQYIQFRIWAPILRIWWQHQKRERRVYVSGGFLSTATIRRKKLNYLCGDIFPPWALNN